MEHDGGSAAHKKKRAYAAQAYDFGANAGLAAGAAQPAATIPAVGIPQSPQEPLAAQFGQMNLGLQPVQQAPQMQPPPQHLNQLYPTDLVTQPFNVMELDLPPPQINLPPNVCIGIPIAQPSLTRTDERHTITLCKLPSEICPINTEHGPDYTFIIEEISTPICPRHSALYISARCRRSSTSGAGPGHFKMSALSSIHQPFRYLSRSRA